MKDCEKLLAFDSPFWTDKEPYCNTIRLISNKEAIAYTRRKYIEMRGVIYPGSDDEALSDFITENFAWKFEGN